MRVSVSIIKGNEVLTFAKDITLPDTLSVIDPLALGVLIVISGQVVAHPLLVRDTAEVPVAVFAVSS